MDKKIIIAVDGFSSTGKSTLAKEIAKALNYIYVDTGAMYRAVTLYAINNGFVLNGVLNEDDFLKKLPSINLKFQYNTNLFRSEIYLNDVNVDEDIRSMEVSGAVSKVAALPPVREKLVEQQRSMGLDKGIVMDGRDIGTVVFPDAELKLFMTAAPSERATRRYNELKASGKAVQYEEVLKNIEERDYIDSNRQDSPLRKAEDAIEIDNTNLTREQQFNKVMDIVAGVLKSEKV
ncbi:(d)CMP kinase [Flavobacterium sp. RNTU_13]|uniref:(d)CMP kinase n=1 Tax=Flavobacterium sp. RNTU_13 TaxID=3375145 RepID=UPI00398717C8